MRYSKASSFILTSSSTACTRISLVLLQSRSLRTSPSMWQSLWGSRPEPPSPPPIEAITLLIDAKSPYNLRVLSVIACNLSWCYAVTFVMRNSKSMGSSLFSNLSILMRSSFMRMSVSLRSWSIRSLFSKDLACSWRSLMRALFYF